MAKETEKKSDYENPVEAEDAEGGFEDEDPAIPERTKCPNCGWHNTRPSYSKTFLDAVLRIFSLRPFRCRSCGNRFRVRRASRN